MRTHKLKDTSADSATVMWGLEDDCKKCIFTSDGINSTTADDLVGAVIPVAGHYYGPKGWLSQYSSLDVIRNILSLIFNTGKKHDKLRTPLNKDQLHHLVSNAFLWMYPEPFISLPEDELTLDSQSKEQALRAYPSLHTCLLHNVVVITSLLREGLASKFTKMGGALPPVYLSCAINFERDDKTVCKCEKWLFLMYFFKD